MFPISGRFKWNGFRMFKLFQDISKTLEMVPEDEAERVNASLDTVIARDIIPVAVLVIHDHRRVEGVEDGHDILHDKTT